MPRNIDKHATNLVNILKTNFNTICWNKHKWENNIWTVLLQVK